MPAVTTEGIEAVANDTTGDNIHVTVPHQTPVRVGDRSLYRARLREVNTGATGHCHIHVDSRGNINVYQFRLSTRPLSTKARLAVNRVAAAFTT